VGECCAQRGVEAACQARLCDVERPPTAAGAFNLALTCRGQLPLVAPCLADGRDHSACCRARGVGGECLRLCAGHAQANFSMASVLCLSLDVQSIYMCFREGYGELGTPCSPALDALPCADALPSPPVNLTVEAVTSSTASVSWSAPASNGHKVDSYTLYYKPNRASAYKKVC